MPSNATPDTIMETLNNLGLTIQNNHKEVVSRLEALEASDKEQWDRIGPSTPPSAVNGDANGGVIYVNGGRSLDTRVTGHDHDTAAVRADVSEVKQILQNQNRFMGLDLVGNTKSLGKFLASREGLKTVGGILLVIGTIYQTIRGWGWVH